MAVLDGQNGAYLKVAALTWLGLTLLCIAICVFADPYRLFGTSPVRGLTLLKPRIYQQLVMAKTVQLDRVRPRTLLLGNSRVENGFDPASPLWPAHMQPVFNAGLPGYDMFWAARMLDEALSQGPVKTIVLQADFPDFLGRPVPADHERSVSDDERRLHVDRAGRVNGSRFTASLSDAAHATLTLDALVDSLTTLTQQDARFGVTMTPAGFNPLHQYELDVRQIGYAGLFAQKLAAYRSQLQHAFHPDFSHPERIEDFRYLQHILRTADKNDAKLIIFIPPYHAEFLQLIRDQGLWPEFEAWKRALVRAIASEVAAKSSKSEVELVDFSGDNAFIQESVPQKGDTRAMMRWYWEPGHFKSALGNEVLKRLLTGHGQFGESLFLSSSANMAGTEARSARQ